MIAFFQIYKKYYKPLNKLHYRARQPVFDFAVHSGHKIAIKTLQKILAVEQTGLLDKLTIKLSKNFNNVKYAYYRLKYLTKIKNYAIYKKNYTLRVLKSVLHEVKANEKYTEHFYSCADVK